MGNRLGGQAGLWGYFTRQIIAKHVGDRDPQREMARMGCSVYSMKIRCSFTGERVLMITDYPAPAVHWDDSQAPVQETIRLLEKTDWRDEAEWNRVLEMLK